jgi:hypothetical protein
MFSTKKITVRQKQNNKYNLYITNTFLFLIVQMNYDEPVAPSAYGFVSSFF